MTFGHASSGSVDATTPAPTTRTGASGVEIIRDLVYGQTNQKKLLADVYRPTTPGPHPAVIYIHGGAWRRGTRTDYADARLVPVAAQGYLIASISYRFSHEAAWPAQALDAARALRWLAERADTLGIDPDRLGVWGSSAGGHIAATLAVHSGTAPFGATEPIPVVRSAVAFFAPFDLVSLATDPPDDGAVLPAFIKGRAPDPISPELSLVGLTQRGDDLDRLREASPLTHVTTTSAPLLMVAGGRDAMMPLAQARRMAAALEAARVTHQLLVIDGATHEDDAFHSPAVLGAVTGWLAAPSGAVTPRHGDDGTAPRR